MQKKVAGHGIAVIPSTVLVESKRLHVGRLACRGKPLQTGRAVLWDHRRALPDYAQALCEMLADHMREIFRPRGRNAERAKRKARD